MSIMDHPVAGVKPSTRERPCGRSLSTHLNRPVAEVKVAKLPEEVATVMVAKVVKAIAAKEVKARIHAEQIRPRRKEPRRSPMLSGTRLGSAAPFRRDSARQLRMGKVAAMANTSAEES